MVADPGPSESPPGPVLAFSAGAGPRLDVFLTEHLGVARGEAQRLVREGLVAVAGEVAWRPSRRLLEGQRVEVSARAPEVEQPPEALAPRLVYEDELFAVVDKPPGMVVHPGPGHRQGTLAQLVQAWGGSWSQAGGADRPGIVHRLDRGTSGLLALARTEHAHQALAQQLRERTMGREYWGLAEGEFQEDRGRIEAALSRDPRQPRRMAVGPGGRGAATEFTVLERWPGYTTLQLRLLTGRTHQIRVHLAYIGRPLVGDGVYGSPAARGSERPSLHAAMLHLRHPGDGREMEFVSPLPLDLERLRRRLGAPRATGAWWPWESVPSQVK